MVATPDHALLVQAIIFDPLAIGSGGGDVFYAGLDLSLSRHCYIRCAPGGAAVPCGT